MKLLLVVALIGAALAQDETAGSSARADTPDYEGVMQNSPESTFDMGDEGAGNLVRPGGEQAAQAEKAAANGTAVEAAPSKCMCKGVDNGAEDGAMLSAGWKKRAKKCASEQSGVTSETADGEKCTVLKTPRCEDKEARKKGDQCSSKPKTAAQKAAKAAAAAKKAEAAEGAELGAAASAKSKCLSKYCNDADNLNRAKGSLSPPSSKECYDACNKAHCVNLFDAGWEHWYECAQTCIGSCYKIADE